MTPTPITVTRVARLPRGSVRLLATALGTGWGRPVALLRALHAAWLVAGLDDEQRRIVVAHQGGRLVGVNLSVRYDARPSARRLLVLATQSLAVGFLLALATLHVPSAIVGGAILGVAAVGVAGAVLFDGRDGARGARLARRRAGTIGLGRSWGRGLIAVTVDQRSRGVGRRLIDELIGSLPTGHAWLPVAHTPRSAALYHRLGARPLGGAASELTAGGLLTTAA